MNGGNQMSEEIFSPLALDGWLEFNRRKWGVESERVTFRFPNAEIPSLHAVLPLTRRGRIFVPNLNPYLPLTFQPTPTKHTHRVLNQWIGLASMLAEEMRRRGLANATPLPPLAQDMRPWQWAGFRAAPKYTLVYDFPFTLDRADGSIRTDMRKAHKLGYRCDRTTDMSAIMEVLRQTEARQGFTHYLTAAELTLARELLGDEHLLAYMCYAPDGRPASVAIVLHAPRTVALVWVIGTVAEHLPTGANRLLMAEVIADSERAGAEGFDFAGANIRNVAGAKAAWGARLAPYYTVDGYGLRSLAKWLRDWWRF